MSSFNLNALGAELDASRRSRSLSSHTWPSPRSQASPTDWSASATRLPALSPSSSTTSAEHSTPSPTSPLSSLPTLVGKGAEEVEERPYPLCLLCLNRPPSAVLLPCCHLNLCYLCAPMLILRQSAPSPCFVSPSTDSDGDTPLSPSSLSSQSLSLSDTDPHSTSIVSDPHSELTPITIPSPHNESARIPFNILLARATANHPKSRRLAGGGYVARQGLGKEVRGDELLPPTGGGEGAQNHLGFVSGLGLDIALSEEDGRVRIDREAQERRGGARCPLCREGVRGWLRVYTG